MFEKLANRKPVLFLSGGLDSLLLLVLLIEQGKGFEIIQFRTLWSKKQRERADYWIKKCNLRVYSYPPAQVNLVGDGQDIGVIFEYAVGNGVIPLVRDVIQGEACIADLDGQRMHTMPLDVDLGIVGTRKDDYHPFMGQPVKAQEFEVGGMQFICPLWNYSRERVRQELEARGIDATEATDEEDTGNLIACSRCLEEGEGQVWCPQEQALIDRVSWNRHHNLQMFQEAYGFKTLE